MSEQFIPVEAICFEVRRQLGKHDISPVSVKILLQHGNANPVLVVQDEKAVAQVEFLLSPNLSFDDIAIRYITPAVDQCVGLLKA